MHVYHGSLDATQADKIPASIRATGKKGSLLQCKLTAMQAYCRYGHSLVPEGPLAGQSQI